MLINLRRWKRLNIPARASEYFHRISGPTDFLQQEALNAVLWDSWLAARSALEFVASLTGRAYGPYKRFSWGPPGIVHFAGRFKPWRMRVGGPFASLYDEFLAKSGGEIRRTASVSDTMLGVYDRYLRNYLDFAPDFFTEDTPTAVLVRQVLGAIAQFEKASSVAKLAAARKRKREREGRLVVGQRS